MKKKEYSILLKFVFVLSALVLCGNVTGIEKKSVFSKESPYYFDDSISREVLERYLDRSVTAGNYLVPGDAGQYKFPYRWDDERMLKNIGAKFIGRAIYRWGDESDFGDPIFFTYAKEHINRLHEFDPEIIFQGCLFEFVSRDVNNLKIPSWVFEAYNLPIENRTFRVGDMIKRATPENQAPVRGTNGGIPMINNLETQLYFIFLLNHLLI